MLLHKATSGTQLQVGSRKGKSATRRKRIGTSIARVHQSQERSKKMGAVHVTTTIRNPADPERFWEGLFLVDTGATDCMVPRCHLEEIGLVPKGQRIYELADGSPFKVDITTGDIEFMGDLTAGTILFGDDDIEPILGVTALESVGIEVDPRNQRLKRLPAVRLK
uniref:Clan AA aspartic protease, AF_0612 family n=1 Tax=Candidatus Kentrum sp. LFY TaxID=2126342 RepID=A0A450UT00_9GAMM|nr:MAG: clan AA aspartic protease, AF_0612 family [Candidatus Kentron sp. LFY]